MQFGERIRELRESKELLQRQLAASLEIDTPMFSKIERGDRKAKKEQVEQLATLLETDRRPLLTLWLTDQIIDLVNTEEFALDAVRLAEKQLAQLDKK
jgi:transcriptional regulator with XRE-family HTH domain